MWNGAADALKDSPARIIASPTSMNASSPATAASAIAPKRSSPVAPYTSAEPKSSTAEPNEPITRYLRPASSDASRSPAIAQST